MNTPKPAPAGTTAKRATETKGVQVLKPGRRRITSDTKFGQDGCGY